MTGLPQRLAAGLWDFACRAPLALSALFVALGCGLSLTNRPLWYSDEVRYGEVYRNLVDGGHWWLLHLNGQPYPDKPPVFFWLARLLDLVPGVTPPANLFLAVAVSAFLFLAATQMLTRTIGLPRETQAATQLVLLSTLFFALLQHYVRMDLFFGAVILTSIALLWSHFFGGAGPGRAYLGFAAAGLAVLVKGPLGFVFPVLTIVAFLVLRGEWRRILGRTFGLGLLITAGVVGIWLAGLVVLAGPDYLIDRIFGQQVVGRAKDAYRHKESWDYYLRTVPIAFLPWTAALLALPLRQIASADWWQARRSAGPVAFAVTAAIAILGFLTLLSGKSFVYVLPALPFLAMITAHALVIDAPRIRAAVLTASVLLALFGFAVLAAVIVDGKSALTGPILGAVLLALAVPLSIALRKTPPLALTGLTTLVGAWILSQALITLPDLSPRLSTRDAARTLAGYARQGYTPVAYRTYSGVFGFYLGRSLEEIQSPDRVDELLASGKSFALITDQRLWSDLAERADALTVVATIDNDVAGGAFVIALHD